MTDQRSTAFEKLVTPTDESDDDLVGLRAYAYYKRDKRDRARQGTASEQELRQHHTILTHGLVDQYRESALRRLEAYAKTVVAEVEPDIRASARIAEIENAKIEIIHSVRTNTAGWQSILWNVLAWLISLAITVIIAFSFGKVAISISSGG